MLLCLPSRYKQTLSPPNLVHRSKNQVEGLHRQEGEEKVDEEGTLLATIFL